MRIHENAVISLLYQKALLLVDKLEPHQMVVLGMPKDMDRGHIDKWKPLFQSYFAGRTYTNVFIINNALA